MDWDDSYESTPAYLGSLFERLRELLDNPDVQAWARMITLKRGSRR